MAQSKKQKKDAARKRARQRARQANTKPPSTRVQMEDTIANLQAALMNMRQMYDASMQEQETLKAQIVQRDQIIAALAVEYSGVSVKRLTIEEVGRGDYVGYEQELEDDELFIFAIHKDDLEEEDEEAEPTEEMGEEDEG